MDRDRRRRRRGHAERHRSPRHDRRPGRRRLGRQGVLSRSRWLGLARGDRRRDPRVRAALPRAAAGAADLVPPRRARRPRAAPRGQRGYRARGAARSQRADPRARRRQLDGSQAHRVRGAVVAAGGRVEHDAPARSALPGAAAGRVSPRGARADRRGGVGADARAAVRRAAGVVADRVVHRARRRRGARRHRRGNELAPAHGAAAPDAPAQRAGRRRPPHGDRSDARADLGISRRAQHLPQRRQPPAPRDRSTGRAVRADRAGRARPCRRSASDHRAAAHAE